jgi:dihydrofolate synthase/folylpolyglutamate synthase
VAGTNGKGSVCAMVESTARAAGLRTGLFTSPHLCRFNERIRLDGEEIDDDRFAQALAVALDPSLPELTFFETLTVAALWLFHELDIDLAILEVGLGGRLDATNVVERPLGCAVVSIGLDHTELLGHELDQIGREKAGILKPGCPAVLGDLPPDAARAVHDVARQVGAEPIWRVAPLSSATARALADGPERADATIRYAIAPGNAVDVVAPEGEWRGLRPALAGPHQAHNTAVAAGLVARLASRWPTMPGHFADGVSQVRWPGRLETLERDGVRIVVDCAHNAHGVDALVAAVTGGSIPPLRPEQTLLLFGAVADKPWREMLDRLAPLAARRIYTEPLEPIAGRRSADPCELVARFDGTVEPSPRRALERALGAARAGDTILVAGSIFLAGATRAALLGLGEHRIVPA